jgi:hypothetical protein
MFSLGSAFGMLVSRCHQRAHCNERDLGTSRRQLSDQVQCYRCAGTERAHVSPWPIASEIALQPNVCFWGYCSSAATILVKRTKAVSEIGARAILRDVLSESQSKGEGERPHQQHRQMRKAPSQLTPNRTWSSLGSALLLAVVAVCSALKPKPQRSSRMRRRLVARFGHGSAVEAWLA